MIVTTGGRCTRSAGSSSNAGAAESSSATEVISIVRSNSSAMIWIASSGRVCVSVAIWPSIISFLMTSGTGTRSDSATSLTFEPVATRTVSIDDCASTSSGAIVSL